MLRARSVNIGGVRGVLCGVVLVDGGGGVGRVITTVP